MGTPSYMAPECIHNKASEFPSDIYSLGCIFYNLIVGFPPFVNGSDYLIFKDVLEGKVRFYKHLFREEEVQYIKSLIELESEKRPDIEEVIVLFKKLRSEISDTPFMTCDSEINKVLECSRQRCEEAKENISSEFIESEVEKVKSQLKEIDMVSDVQEDVIYLHDNRLRIFFLDTPFLHYPNQSLDSE